MVITLIQVSRIFVEHSYLHVTVAEGLTPSCNRSASWLGSCSIFPGVAARLSYV